MNAQNEKTDSIDREYILPLVSIIEAKARGIPIQIVENSKDLVEFLQKQSAVNIKSYYNGGLATLSYRGTNAQQSNIEWNGLNINSPFLGLYDLSMLPIFADGTEKVVLSDNAIGKSFELQTNIKEKNTGSFTYEIGSFGFQKFALTNNLFFKTSKGDVNQSIKILNRKAENKFQLLQNNEVQYLENASFNFSDYKYYFNFWNQENRLSLTLNSWLQNYKRDIPFATPNAYQNDWNWRNILSAYTDLGLYKSIGFSLAFFRETIEYNGDFSWLNSFIAKGNYNQQFSSKKFDYSAFNFEAQYRRNVAFTPYYSINRIQNLSNFSFQFKFEKGVSAFKFDLEQIINNRKLYLPNYKVSYETNKPFSVKIATHHYTRIPTLNDMFWQPLGNPNLKAESGFKNEISFLYKKAILGNLLNSSNFGIELFHNHITNYIQWRPQFGGAWQPENIKTVRILGFEPHVNLQFEKNKFKLSNYISGTYTNAKNIQSAIENDASVGKQLMYVPAWKANFNSTIHYKKTKLNYFLNWQSKQFTNTSNTQQTDAFVVADISLEQTINIPKIKTGINFIFSINNLFNKNYEMYANRPMPWRNYSFTTKFIFNEKN